MEGSQEIGILSCNKPDPAGHISKPDVPKSKKAGVILTPAFKIILNLLTGTVCCNAGTMEIDYSAFQTLTSHANRIRRGL